MVMPRRGGVHAEHGPGKRHPDFPQASIFPANQNWENSCAHTAIIPTNSVIDASAAASSTKIFNMAASPLGENI